MLRYALKHDKRHIAELAGPLTVKFTLRQCMDAIPEPEILAHWVRHDLACIACMLIMEVPSDRLL